MTVRMYLHEPRCSHDDAGTDRVEVRAKHVLDVVELERVGHIH